MTDLRKAAKMALEACEKPFGERAQAVEDAIEALRQALAQPLCQTGSQCIGGKCPECKRQWVWLTDEEVAEYAWMGKDVVSVIKEVQATLKEKNCV